MYEFILYAIVLLVQIFLIVVPRVPILNFTIGVIAIGIAGLILGSDEVPFVPFSQVLLIFVSIICLASAAINLKRSS